MDLSPWQDRDDALDARSDETMGGTRLPISQETKDLVSRALDGAARLQAEQIAAMEAGRR